MISNVFDHVQFYCMAHKEPKQLYVYKGANSPFFACVKYMRKDENHPDGHEENEQACSNRMSFNLATSIMEQISKLVEEAILSGAVMNFTGYVFTYKAVEVTILEYSVDAGVKKVGIRNRAEIGSWQ